VSEEEIFPAALENVTLTFYFRLRQLTLERVSDGGAGSLHHRHQITLSRDGCGDDKALAQQQPRFSKGVRALLVTSSYSVSIQQEFFEMRGWIERRGNEM
jgi:hypothetical protein